MNSLYLIEIIASILSISGSLMMAKSTKTNTKPLYFAFALFGTANLFFLFFFTANGIIPIAIQMLFFFITEINGFLKNSENFKRDLKLIIMVLIPYIVFFTIYMIDNMNTNIDWTIKPIETFASLLAVIGSFILSSQNHITRSYAFILFLIADSILIYVGYSHSMFAFMFQAMFFVGTSTVSYYRTMKEEIQDFFNFNKTVEIV